ncbi:transmembrane protein, putative (macronuclear) [Tetrahymena thermophila SB210]|uniref:Transmembrane protein, putative n=1 Tax=Tetrahymena thermophila (strain SB210) TaxID=312017 RepID=W7XD19_TETTS|nr:transmembrane protein, putative [Tetrahymena thermophila SB210]EWS71706.1 transmembrane protein, putative [Tetrahymena thermophila SB210]|eukprot:XP_012655747.1 transmembrane protein, putative [Tetrahymena thermophila SB210]
MLVFDYNLSFQVVVVLIVNSYCESIVIYLLALLFSLSFLFINVNSFLFQYIFLSINSKLENRKSSNSNYIVSIQAKRQTNQANNHLGFLQIFSNKFEKYYNYLFIMFFFILANSLTQQYFIKAKQIFVS